MGDFRSASVWGWLLFGLLWGICSPLLAPGEDKAPSLDEYAASLIRRIDERLASRWQEAGITPNPVAGDAEFLRRASLDLTGVIPSVSDVRAFLADTSTDKRARLIDRLLNKPNHATRLTNHWRDALLPTNNALQFGQSAQFEQWLRGKFADNTPYDQIVRELLTATGNLGQPGPVLYYTSLELKPELLAASTSRIFLGVQISCAECHKHPFDHWTQEDFWGYAAFFARLQRPQPPQQVAFQVLEGAEGEVKLPATGTVVAPRFLGTETPPPGSDQTRRQQLAAWLTAKENPYFAKATVNRVWALLFGYGLVNPIDDLGGHNTPVDETLLTDLAHDFAEHGHDLRRLLRALTSTRAYGLSSEVASESQGEAPLLFQRMAVKSLNAEQIWDCVAEATCRREPAADYRVQQPQAFQFNQGKQAFLAKFEAPAQAATEFQSGIPQALSMMNGDVIRDATDLSKSDLLLSLIDSPFFTEQDQVEILFMATLTRLPTEPEQEKFLKYVTTGGPAGERPKALADILWALLNSTEFLLNH